MLVHVNVNVPEEEWSHALKAKFGKHGTNPCKQKLSGAIFVWGEVGKSVEQIKEGTTLHYGPSGYWEIAPFIGLFELASTFGDVEHNRK